MFLLSVICSFKHLSFQAGGGACGGGGGGGGGSGGVKVDSKG